ncbi:hypothetical protein DAPPUDRAFT_104230 [Daphnia pulex]|uniref:Peptidase S1 domain-containing protein n=1 Tax=Daphnia pulex TaxID=6669 RepID=E9GLN1_DAPPU|nr:hypothetical protein DAPPUDRAFT_104230 [Daphnia pulex]|eukprot:EFX79659.1 hypothetical protein DAPPUDRAFT_104230 [Daphnia pulex]
MASDLAVQTSTRLATSNFANPLPIPMMYAINPYTGLLSQPYPNFPFWPYPHLYKPASSFSDVDNVAASSSSSPQSRQQQNITCGVGPASLPRGKTPTVGIVGGTNAEKNSWPFMVGLRIAGMSTVFCGGSIISTTRILTAAHCVNELSTLDVLGLKVSLGMHSQGDGNTLRDDAQQTRRITRVVYHIDFNMETMVNDVAILTMDPPLNYSKAISPVCLPPAKTDSDQFSKNAAIIGWGLLNSDGSKPVVLQQATVKITKKEKCRRAWDSVVPILNQHICAGADEKGVCQGDSGGPLVVQTRDGSSAWTQVGVTSFGSSCSATSNQPSVFASVAFFRDWIDTYMNS